MKVHDNMKAIPRIYGEAVKRKADTSAAMLTSMDDESIYGPVFHCLGFGQAVEDGLASDYKVMILCVAEESYSSLLEIITARSDYDIDLNNAANDAINRLHSRCRRTTQTVLSAPRLALFFSPVMNVIASNAIMNTRDNHNSDCPIAVENGRYRNSGSTPLC